MNNLIYIAGPITNDGKCNGREQWENVYRGLDAYDVLIEKGYVPILPHFSWFFKKHHKSSMTHDDWLDLDFKYIEQCDYFYYIGPSKGSKKELSWAQYLHKTIFNHPNVNNVPTHPFKPKSLRMGET